MYGIGELSKRAGVKVPTIRYYEQMGLSNRFDPVKYLSRLMALPGAWLSSRSTFAAA